jgi:hypothetical protein
MRGHFLLRKSESAQGCIDGIFAHAARARSIGRENKATIPGDAVKLTQQSNGTRCERNAMRPSHLHLRGRDGPNCAIEIDFAPFRPTNLTRTREGQRRQFQSGLRFWGSLVASNGPKQATEGFGFNDGRSMLDHWRRDSSAEGGRRVRICPPGRNGKAKYLPDGCSQPFGGFEPTPSLYLFQDP